MHTYNPIAALEKLEDQHGSHAELTEELCDLSNSTIVDRTRLGRVKRLLNRNNRLIAEGVGYNMGYEACKREMKKTATAPDTDGFPFYVSMSDVALRCQSVKDGVAVYWRDAGAWGVQAKKTLTGPITTGGIGEVKNVAGIGLKTITQEEWAQDNKGHI